MRYFFLLLLLAGCIKAVSQTTTPLKSHLKRAKTKALAAETDLNSYLTFRIDSALSMQKAKLDSLNQWTRSVKVKMDTLIQNSRHQRLYNDTIMNGTRAYIVVHTFSASSSAGAYSNLTTINSSTVSTATVPSHSVYVPNGLYKLLAVNVVLTSTATPIFEGWVFTGSVTASGDKQNIGGNLSDADMQKFIGDFRFDGTFTGTGTVQKSNGRVVSYSALNVPFLINVTANAIHYLAIARGSWTPSANAQHKIIFFLERVR